ncbi:protein kinase family protein [Vallicoccus soli]|uniref:Serine/threonine protein kinase n=1 Tax=Vallicoccus soli TaxID=2339232 RepID=A0A3A3ZG35_9ACTN|nr:protein kinase family protein [Vallicoccus soli]RJK94162.1 serine/threonine protein kinase [Vallicoccus soli]
MAFAVEPGQRLAGRYRLSRPAAGSASPHGTSTGSAGSTPGSTPGSTARPVLAPALPALLWQGHDEVLDRPVGVRVLPAGDPLAGPVLAAARRAAAVDDPRFVAVLDADEAGGLAYVVTEWVEARDLTALLAAGPLADVEAQALVAELARALSVAHRAGLAHGRLLPEHVLLTEAGRLKVAGLGVSAAAHPHATPAPDPRREDLRAAGAVLYAALTGRWPLEAEHGRTDLPPAPVVDGEPCAPGQVRAAVPADLDDLACRALGVHRRRHRAPLGGVEELVALLPRTGGSGGESSTGPLPVVPADAPVPLLAAPARPGGARRALSLLVGCVLVAASSLLGYQVVAGLQDADEPAPAPSPPPSAAAPLPPGTLPAGLALPVEGVAAYDPQGDGSEHDERADLAVDGDRGTSWTTQTYFGEPLGGLKEGVGLVVDLGAVRSVGAVTVELDGEGSAVALRAAPAIAGEAPEDPEDWVEVAAQRDVAGTTTLAPERPVDARWLLLWLTELPEVGDGEFRGGVAELAVRS